MTSRVFVDTSAWLAILDVNDQHHDEASMVQRSLVRSRARLTTSNWVVGETYTIVHRRLGAGPAHAFLQHSRASGRLDRIHVPAAWESSAEDLLAQFSDQTFSYVDATSFIVMRRLGISVAFAYDNHFLTAGFRTDMHPS